MTKPNRVLLVLVAYLCCVVWPAAEAFATSTRKRTAVMPQLIKTSLSAQNQPNNDSLLDRFTSPIIDDPFLPLTEAGLAQVVVSRFS